MMRNRITNFWNVAAPLLLGSIALASLPLGFLWLRVGFASAAFACLIAGRFIAAALLAITSAAGLAYFLAPATVSFRIYKSQHIVVAIALLSVNSFGLSCPPTGGWVVI
jgi:hypothetical protein